MRVLLVEDDAILGEAVRDHVRSLGHATDWFDRLADAELAIRAVPYELALLDLRLPDGAGLSFLRRLRKSGNAIPVIILTAFDQISDRIEGLNAGADDYLIKPFHLDELAARIQAVARRSKGRSTPVISYPGLEIDQSARSVTVDGVSCLLTSREWAVLSLLAERSGAILSKAQIEEALYAFGAETESNTVEVYISRLRKKIGRHRIKNVRNLGYRLE